LLVWNLIRTARKQAGRRTKRSDYRFYAASTSGLPVEEADVSKSTFLRAFPAKEAVAIEAETQLWSTYLTALAKQNISGVVLTALRDTLTSAAVALEPEWDRRYVATRLLVLTSPALWIWVVHGVAVGLSLPPGSAPVNDAVP
jgi:hypothetical protein